MVFGMSFLQAQIGLDELQIRDQDQLQIYKDKVPDSTYKWYWGVGYTDDESIQDAIHCSLLGCAYLANRADSR